MSLKKQLEDILCNLNKAYQKLDYNKETLNQQSDNVKEQIANNIVMQIENLNQRKQWLLNQLELVKSDKMESIQRKQDAIKCSLSNIQKLLCDPPKFGNSHIKESIESINSLMSEETRPFIAFRSDPALLREIISQYGVILKQYCGHFADPTRPSISLPSVVEEEDDEESLTFNKKNEGTKNEESSMHVPIYPTNSSIVRAWLMTTNDFTNNIDVEFGTPKSDSDSFIRVDSLKDLESREQKTNSPVDVGNDCKETSPSYNDDTLTKSDYSDILRPFNDIKNQSNVLWLSESSQVDDGKEADHCELVKKACVGGSCKTFSDCRQKENCCNKLLDRNRPQWNKWLLDNNVFEFELLGNELALADCENAFSREFSRILKSGNDKWLDSRRGDVKPTLKRQNEATVVSKDDEVGNKWTKMSPEARVSIFNEPLEKWVMLGREMEWRNNQHVMTESVNKSMGRVSLTESDVHVSVGDSSR